MKRITNSLAVLIALGVVFAACSSRAQVGNDNPTGITGQFNDLITTGGSYDPYTGNAIRTVTDIVASGGVGTYPLAFTRIANSRGYSGSSLGGGGFCPGAWQHSYAWMMGDSDRVDQPVTVNFPDGRVITFSYSASDPYYRGSAGVKERFQPFNSSTNLGYLLFTDGGKVEFKRKLNSYIDADTGLTVYYYTYTAQALIDPFGQRTVFAYNNDGTLQKATEPGGRWLQLTYTTISGSKVISQVSASDGRSVAYAYASKSFATGSSYLVLDNVTYFGDNTLKAKYTYCAPNVGVATGAPLLLTCDDPMYLGPMRRIGYTYATTNNQDGTAAVRGEIRSENYYDGTNIGAAVSTLTVNGSNRVDQRGDGPSRTFTYTGYKLTSLTDFKGVAESRGYDTSSFVNSVMDRNSHTTNLTNNSLSSLVTLTTYPLTAGDTPPSTPRGTVTYTYGYASCPDVNNRDTNNPYYLYSVTDEGGHATIYTRDASKRVTRIDYPDTGYETFTYNSFGQVLDHLLRTGGHEISTYDAAGSKLTFRNPSNATGNPSERYSYDVNLRRSVVTDALGATVGDASHSVAYTYNARGQLTVTTLPTDPVDSIRHTIQNTYSTNGDGTLVSVTDQLGHITSMTYDDYRRPLTKTTPQRSAGDITPRTTYFYYDASGTGNDYTHTDPNVTYIAAPAGDKTTTSYDENLRKKYVICGDASVDAAKTSYSYDNVGNLTSIMTPKEQPGQVPFGGQFTAIAYDERNRLMSATDPLGNVASCTYDAAGRKASTTRANGQVTTYDSYDSMNRVLQQTVKQTPDPDAVTKYTYSPSDLSYTMQDPRLVATSSAYNYSYIYDTTGRKTSVTYPPDAGAVQRSESWHYDAAGRIDTFTNRTGTIQTLTSDGLNRLTNSSWNDSGVTPSVAYTYDAASRLKTIVNSNATISRMYLDDNLLSTETTTYADATARVITYTYDADANKRTLQYPNNAYGFTYSYTYRNQLSTISNTSGGANVISYTYDLDGNFSTRAPANGTLPSSYTYDALDRVTHITHSLTSNTRSFDYAYDSVSNRSWTKRDGGTGDVFGYDLNDQSTKILLNVANPDTTSPGSQTINYDANGNRTTFAAYGTSDTYTTNNLNQYVSRNSATATYNNNAGMTTGVDGSIYVYDAQNRLLTATKGGSTSTFKYDGLNRQVSRTIGAGSAVYKVYDGWDLLADYAPGSTSPATAYVYGAGGLVKSVTTAGSYYYYQDGSGSTSHLTDGSGNLVEWYRYDLHGAPIVYDASNVIRSSGSIYGIRHLFTGQQWYSELGLYDLRNRFYSPEIGRFLQPDPISFNGDPTNLYRYCQNSPVNRRDTRGLQSVAVEPAGMEANPGLGKTLLDLNTGDDPQYDTLFGGLWQLYWVIRMQTTPPDPNALADAIRDQKMRDEPGIYAAPTPRPRPSHPPVQMPKSAPAGTPTPQAEPSGPPPPVWEPGLGSLGRWGSLGGDWGAIDVGSGPEWTFYPKPVYEIR